MKMNFLAAAAMLSLGAVLPATAATSAITYKPVPAASGVVLWFNSVLRPAGIPIDRAATICITQQVITYRVGRETVTIDVPDATIAYKPWESSYSSYFSGTRWESSSPTAAAAFEGFAGGTEFPLTAEFPAGVTDMTWSARFESDVAGISVQWRWGAASYTRFSDNGQALNVVPVDVRHADRAGTPFAFKNYVVGGNDVDPDDFDDTRFTGTRSLPRQAVADFSTTCGGAY